MLLFSRGQKSKLADVTTQTHLVAGLEAQAPGLTLDFSCFGVDVNNQLSDDRYFVFFNQPASPEGAITQNGPGNGDAQTFAFDLSRLPNTITKLVFVVTIDGEGTLAQLGKGHFRLLANGIEVMRFEFKGSDFSSEVALMIAEVYLKDVWRVAAVGQGFAGGLAALLKHFGGQEVDEQADSVVAAPEPAPVEVAPSSVTGVSKPRFNKDQQLQLRMESLAPSLANLSQSLATSLQQTDLQDVRARLALVLDASGAMQQQYQGGVVQAVVSRIATLALRLDDDDELDVWAFAESHTRLPSVTLDTMKGYVLRATHNAASNSIIGNLGTHSNALPVIREVIDTYRDSALPAFVVFISEGGIQHSTEFQSLIKEASTLPIFWQFVGIGGQSYGVLEHLDTVSGRAVDNANFFSLDDLYDITDEELYRRLLNEFPAWLRAAKAQRILSV